MALSIVSTATEVFTGVSTTGGFSFSDLRTLRFFDPDQPVALGSCYLDYTTDRDPVIGVSTYNVGVPSTGQISISNLTGAVRELRLDITGSGNKVDIKDLPFGSELTNTIRKTVAITTNCVITSDDPNVAALSITGGYDNVRITVSGQILGAGGLGGPQNSGSNGGTGGAALNIVNPSGIAAEVQITETGQLKAGGGGGGAGENGVKGSNYQYVCGSGCNGCQRSCRPGCCYDCGGGFNCCFDPCCSTYTNYCTAQGGAGGQGGVGGSGRGGNYPSGSLAGGTGTNGSGGQSPCGGRGTDAGDGGLGGDYGKYGTAGSPAPSTGGAGPGLGGSPGYAITGGYKLVGSIVGIVTGILPDPV